MPYVSVSVDLEDFDTSDLIDELEARGYKAHEAGEAAVAAEDLDYVQHLALCGLIPKARQEALKVVSTAIGRAIH